MDFQDWCWLFESKKTQRSQEWAGSLTDGDVIELSRALDEALANGQD